MNSIILTKTIANDGGKWRRYPEYKVSGVEWLGAIPAGWDINKLKFMANEPLKYGANEAAELNDPDLPRFVRITDIDESGILREDTFRSLPEEIAAPYLLKEGDILFARSGATVGKTLMYDSSWGRACYAGYLIRFRAQNKKVSPKFVSYFTNSSAYQSWRDSIFIQATIQNISADKYANLVVCWPPLPEQHAIAAFLDRDTAKIDALIEKKRRLISLLEEKRVSIISHAVTKGLDPDVPMKDSGVEWLGEIPAGWDVWRLKFAAKLESGHTPSRTIPEYWENCTIPWVTLNDVAYLKNHEYISQTENYINELGLANSSARLLPQDTVILSRDATVGRCGILGRPMATSQHFIDWICSEKLNPRYLLMLFREPMQQEFDRLTMGATIRTIGMPDVNSFTVPIPPITEQRLIVTFVDMETPKIDKLLLKIQEAINKLQEYRTALISAAVTGKIDVREVVKEGGIV